MGKIKQIKTRVENMLFGAYTNIGIDKPSNHDEILDFVFEDILSNADLTSKNLLFDVRKSLLKWIKTKNATYVHVYKPASQKLDTGMLGDRKCTEGLHIPSYMGKATPRITGFNPGVIENVWSEIRNNFEDEGIVYIDAWEDEDDDSDGRVIATIDKSTRKVEYKDDRAKTDKYAQEMIAEALNDIDSTRNVFVCSDCRSDNVQYQTWSNANSDKVIEPILHNGMDGFCPDCQKHVKLVLLEMKGNAKVAGFQVVGEDETPQYGEIHPQMDASFCIYNLTQARNMMDDNNNGEEKWRLLTIWEGDVEEPTMMFEGDPRN